MKENLHITSQCRQTSMAINDALELVGGKWTVMIIMALLVRKVSGFTELKKEIEGISSKVLSDNLKRLEQQCIVNRTIPPAQNGKVEYQLTTHGCNLEQLLKVLSITGINHRHVLTGRDISYQAIEEFERYGTKNII